MFQFICERIETVSIYKPELALKAKKQTFEIKTRSKNTYDTYLTIYRSKNISVYVYVNTNM